MGKTLRHRAIKEIIANLPINSQDILLNMLIEKGFNVTQATLSRDIKELKIAKIPTSSGEYAYQLPHQSINDDSERSRNLSSFGFISIEFSGSLAVIKTRPGYAMGIAGDIDARATSTILGTVAGDDTILIIPRENISREKILESLSDIIPTIQ
ncbi:arginine repressor [Dysgonomonas sp. 520]|uniref:arginine repressor n=1 Tax=Dysgonomonas sp. 520 TaxID=2302931 RepID=UPI001625C2F3|nr:arginine repressor [Dysgonomonas sp. 520]